MYNSKSTLQGDITHSSFALDLLKSHCSPFVNTFTCHRMAVTTLRQDTDLLGEHQEENVNASYLISIIYHIYASHTQEMREQSHNNKVGSFAIFLFILSHIHI